MLKTMTVLLTGIISAFTLMNAGPAFAKSFQVCANIRPNAKVPRGKISGVSALNNKTVVIRNIRKAADIPGASYVCSNKRLSSAKAGYLTLKVRGTSCKGKSIEKDRVNSVYCNIGFTKAGKAACSCQ